MTGDCLKLEVDDCRDDDSGEVEHIIDSCDGRCDGRRDGDSGEVELIIDSHDSRRDARRDSGEVTPMHDSRDGRRSRRVLAGLVRDACGAETMLFPAMSHATQKGLKPMCSGLCKCGASQRYHVHRALASLCGRPARNHHVAALPATWTFEDIAGRIRHLHSPIREASRYTLMP